MTAIDVLAPVFVQVALTFVLLFAMGTMRTRSVRRRETRVKDIVLGQPAWPEAIQKVGNAYHNQFQLPVLFYALVAIALPLRKADFAFVVMAWLFVISRVVHAAIHTTSNDIRLRFAAFVFGALVLLAMWIIFAARMLLAL